MTRARTMKWAKFAKWGLALALGGVGTLALAQTAAAPSTTTMASTTTNCGISEAFLSNNMTDLLKEWV